MKRNQIISSFLLSLISFSCSIPLKWSNDQIGICSYLFRPSKREESRENQFDPILLWLGKPSYALHVEGKFGPIPMPSIWVSFVNILYVTSCDLQKDVDQSSSERSQDSNSYSKRLNEFIEKWLNKNMKYHNRKYYLAGNEEDNTGGAYLLETATQWMISRHNLSLNGILWGNPLHPPMISKYFGHRSFETVNNLTDWSIDRASQNIICNSRYSQVDFVMNDIQFHYTPTTLSSECTVNGMCEYELSTISTYDKCYLSPTDWTRSGSPSYPLPYETVYPTLPTTFLSPPYPTCNPPIPPYQQKSSTLLASLLSSSVSIVIYTSIHKSASAICSFYIGIYSADGLYFHISSQELQSSEHTTEVFNHASLLPYESAWSTDQRQQNVPKALIQDGIEHFSNDEKGEVRIKASGGIVWIQFDDRYAPTLNRKTREKYEELLNRVTAVDILSNLLGKHHSQGQGYNWDVLDYTDLFL